MSWEERRNFANQIINNASLLVSSDDCQKALERVAVKLNQDFENKYPLILAVMGGAIVFAGRLLPYLKFALDFDYAHISRYGDKIGGHKFSWQRIPTLEQVKGRDIILIDDILDEGHTLCALRAKLLEMDASSCVSAVFVNKLIAKEKPLTAEYVGLDIPDKWVFGYGMDAAVIGRNLDAVYALSDEDRKYFI